MTLRDRDYSGFRNTKQTDRTRWTTRFGRDYGKFLLEWEVLQKNIFAENIKTKKLYVQFFFFENRVIH